MAADMKKWLGIGLRFASLIGTYIGAIEQIKSAKPGAEKKQAVLDAIEVGIITTEFAIEKDVLNDPAVLAASSSYIDAYVALQNAITKSKQIRAVNSIN